MTNQALQTIQLNALHDSLDTYLQAVHTIPVLSAEKEHELARELKETGNLEAARQLVLAHLRFVVHIARSYSGYGLPQADLIQEGNIGLMKAIKRFDPDKGVRLVTFAVHWIKSEIHEFVIKNWRIVKVATTKAQRKLFFNLRRAQKQLNWLSPDEAKAVAQDLNVSTQEVFEMERRLNSHDAAFDAPTDDDDASYAPVHYLSAPEQSNPALLFEQQHLENQQLTQLQVGLAALNERDQDIIKRRWLDEEKATLQELAEQYQVSAERIRQLEKNALTKLRQTFQPE